MKHCALYSFRNGVLGIVAAVTFGTAAVADDITGGSSPPALTKLPELVQVESSTWETTVDNGDGTFTFTQMVNSQSTPPHYTGPWYSGGYYGFGYYSWFDQDYGWLHTFPYAGSPGLQILTARLTIRAWDVDSEVSHGYGGEYDGLSGDGNWLDPQYLQGFDDTWSVTVFNVNPNTLLDGVLNLWLNIDMHHTEDWWATTLDYSRLAVTFTQSTNKAPFQPVVQLSPVGCTWDNDNLVVTVVGPTPADPDGDTVTYEYRWLVDTGTGFFVDDEFAGRGDHLGNTVPAADTVYGDRWKVEVIAADEHGARSTANEVSFAQIGECNTPPIANAGGDREVYGATVALDGTASSDADGSIAAYLWELYQGGAWLTIGNAAVITNNFGGPGTFQVRLTVWDNAGAADSATVYITVASNTPPTLLCHPSITVNNDPGWCSATVTPQQVDNGSSDLEGPITLALDPPGPYPVGTNDAVDFVVTDAGGLTVSTQVVIVVVDAELPQVNCPGDIVQANDPGQCSALVTYVSMATDNCGLVSLECTPPPGSVFPKGTNIATCVAADVNGNTNTCSFLVIVEDTEGPLVEARPAPNPGDKKIPVAGKVPNSGHNPDGYYQLLAKDNCDASPMLYIKDPLNPGFVAGPFASGDKVKVTQSPDQPPQQKPGPNTVVAHVLTQGEPTLYAVDADGNVSADVSVFVPPPPK